VRAGLKEIPDNFALGTTAGGFSLRTG